MHSDSSTLIGFPLSSKNSYLWNSIYVLLNLYEFCTVQFFPIPPFSRIDSIQFLISLVKNPDYEGDPVMPSKINLSSDLGQGSQC